MAGSVSSVRASGHALSGWRLPAWCHFAWPVITILGIWLGIGLYLREEVSTARAAGMVNGANIARAFEESLIRRIREIDQALRYARAIHARDGNSLNLSSWIDNIGLERPLALQISMTDRDGVVILSNLEQPKERIDLSDRPHFRHFRDHPGDDLFISAPVIGRVSGKASVQFVRMLSRTGGDPDHPVTSQFDGIVVLSVDPDLLVRFYSAVDVGRHGVVSLLGTDGILRARAGDGATGSAPGDGGPIGREALRRAASQVEGGFASDDADSDAHTLTNFHRIAGHPLVIAVTQSVDDLLEDFHEGIGKTAAAGGVATFLVILVAWIGWRDRRASAKVHRTVNAALQNISQGLLMVEPGGRLGVLNPRARELLDIPDWLVPGMRFKVLVDWQHARGEFNRGAPAALVSEFELHRREAPPEAQSYLRQRPNGTVLEVTTKVLDDGSWVRTFTDVTHREQTQEALMRARDAAEAGMRARAQFLAVMSHEIRTPLNGIIGVADLLDGSALSEQQVGYVRIIRQSGSHLLDIINDVLDFTRLENGQIELEAIAFEPRVVLEGVIAMFTAQLRERGVALTHRVAGTVPARVTGDPHRLRQVLLNLVGNAMKFTGEGGIDIALEASEQEQAAGWRLAWAVRDTGLGMPPDKLGKLFQEFSQIDGSITRRFGGTGLGLAISRRLVEAMGGAITVESTPGVGSVFRFHVLVGAASPAAVEPKALAAPPVAASDPLPRIAAPDRLRVLVAEDNRVNRIVARGMLERLGHEVAMVEDGRAAVVAVKTGQHDLVLMDVMMPEMDGLAATRAIRLLGLPTNAIPIIGLTANAFQSDEEACLEAGMDGFLAKPVTLDRLSAAIAAVTQIRAA